MHTLKIAVLAAFACGLLPAPLEAQKKQKDVTQTLQLPKDLPNTAVGETRRLTFYVTPLSARGLLSAQVRDALRALLRETGSNPVLRIRAFVAGSGDQRRVRDLVSETFTDRKLPLPALSLVQAGGLPMEGAQVVIEAVATARKDVNPVGIALISAQPATSPDPLDPVPPLTEKSLAAMRSAVKAAGSDPADVIRVTCFFSTLDNLAASRKLVEAEYGAAALNFVQTQRAPSQALAACEAVARIRGEAGAPLRLLNPEGFAAEPGRSEIALLGSPHAVFTGTQVSFGFQETDARLAFGRLKKVIEQAGGGDIAFVHYYPLSASIAAQVRKVRAEFFDPARPPAGSLLPFESLPSMDAGFAVDAVAIKE